MDAVRATVEIDDEQRAKLLALAARRGEKGFSKLVREALELYLDEIEARERRVKEALGAIGSLDDEDADEIRESVRQLREHWR
jgi:metal-responsive CopG/Arc/MetJ family transcriptional regulator